MLRDDGRGSAGLIAALTAGAWVLGRASSAEPAAPKSVQKWEYNALGYDEVLGSVPYRSPERERFQIALNKLGDEGWELVAVGTPPGWAWQQFYFRRPR